MGVTISLSPIISNFHCCSAGDGILHLDGTEQVRRAESVHYQDNNTVVIQTAMQSAGWIYSLVAYETDMGISGYITKQERDLLWSIKDLSPPSVLSLVHPEESFKCIIHSITLKELENIANPGDGSIFTGVIKVRRI